ncbi:hypothetical protein [Idiomarina sp.]|uniref:hypothetical protein n=1 Tax=Idiomarina sp. TaxID=1874361 RepID=UPI0026222A4C|nr:hypothetical protein [Idiomarina sp.]
MSHKLEEHYLAYRNRFHFGHGTYTPNRQGDIYQPLMSKSLRELARRVPNDVLSSGKLLFDVTSMFSPTIARAPYLSKSVNTNFKGLPYYRDHPLDDWTVTLPAAPHLKKEAEARKKAVMGTVKTQRVRRISDQEYSGVKRAYFLSALEKLQSEATTNSILNEKMLANINWTIKNDGKFSKIWWSRIVSTAEYIDLSITAPLKNADE